MKIIGNGVLKLKDFFSSSTNQEWKNFQGKSNSEVLGSKSLASGLFFSVDASSTALMFESLAEDSIGSESIITFPNCYGWNICTFQKDSC